MRALSLFNGPEIESLCKFVVGATHLVEPALVFESAELVLVERDQMLLAQGGIVRVRSRIADVISDLVEVCTSLALGVGVGAKPIGHFVSKLSAKTLPGKIGCFLAGAHPSLTLVGF